MNFSAGVRKAIAGILLLISAVACTAENRRPGFIVYRLNANPSTLDPALIVDVPGGSIASKLFNGLVRLDDKLQVVPDIAESWTVSPDGLTYTFRLRKGVNFSNGRPVTAGDFEYSFMRVLDPKTRSPNTWVLDRIAGAGDFMDGKTGNLEGLRVRDGQTLEVRLRQPFRPFLQLLTMTAAYVVPREEVRRWGQDFASHPAGTGPFVLSRWLQNRELVLERRNDYFSGSARIKGIVYRVIPEDLTAVAEFELGNLDAIAMPAAELAKYRHDREWMNLFDKVTAINTYYLGMNCSRPPFDRKEVRQAIHHAIDRKRLLETFYERRGRLAGGPVPDLLRKWKMPEPYVYAPAKARAMLKDAGLSGKTVLFYVTADQEVVDMAEFIQAYLKDAGLRVGIRQLEWSAFKEAVNRGEADLFWLSWWADYPDPENFLFPLFHSANLGPAGNRTRYVNKEVDRLIERGQAARDEEEANRFYGEAERLIVQDAPWVFFWHKTDFILRQPWVRDFKAYPIYSMDKGLEVGIEKAGARGR